MKHKNVEVNLSFFFVIFFFFLGGGGAGYRKPNSTEEKYNSINFIF